MNERIQEVDSSRCNTKELTWEFLHLSLVLLVRQIDSLDTRGVFRNPVVFLSFKVVLVLTILYIYHITFITICLICSSVCL